MTELLTRPELTLPKVEAECLRNAYAKASVILEYGSGGSTVMAAEMEGKTVTSVESDEDWANMMRGWFEQNPPESGSSVNVVWADIGKTKAWGYPVNNIRYLDFPNYPLGVWSQKKMRQPDVVLIDGRFRVGCALATAINTKKPVDVYVDDYAGRKEYSVLEKWLGTPEITGRMAYFNVSPMQLRTREFGRVMKLMLRKG